ncbi:MAG: hypothetical protein ACOC4C_04965 [Fibrobacterota bacterium]
MNAFFSPKRAWFVFRNDLTWLYRPFILANIVVLSISLVITLFVYRSGTAWNYYDSLFGPLLYLGGYLYTAGMFSDIHHKVKGASYFLVPASVTEKFASRMIISGILYAVGVVFVMSIFSYLVYLLARVSAGTYLPVFTPFRSEIIKSGGIYLVTQSIFLFGSTVFRKHAFLKTLLIVILISIAISIVQGIIGAYVLKANQTLQVQITMDELIQMFDSLAPVMKFFFWFIMAPIFWFTSVWHLGRIQK